VDEGKGMIFFNGISWGFDGNQWDFMGISWGFDGNQ